MSSAPEIHGRGVLDEKGSLPARELDTFDLPQNIKAVEYTSDEVTAMCPHTGQPDFYKVTIYIEETMLGLESKALKLYLQSFRNEGHFCEQFADIIAQDVRRATHGGRVEALVEQKPRGGVSIMAKAEIP
jgi:7-cyano-7-deazaguanine reductase